MIEDITIYEDDYILVLDKPVGVVVNKSQTTKNDTIQELVENKYTSLFKQYSNEEFLSRSGVVHRLDKDTSGLLLISKNPAAFENLKQQFKSRKVKKEYLAVVLGSVSDDNFEIDAPIKRDPKNRFKMCIHSEGKDAFTSFQVEKRCTVGNLEVTKLIAKPSTGRMHQIRVHLSAVNHPIMGDPVYMTRMQLSNATAVFDRLMLHAFKLSFVHPETGKLMELESNIPSVFNI